jgi:hypothetical protein
MNTHNSHSQFFLLLVVALACACGGVKNPQSAPSDSSSDAVVNPAGERAGGGAKNYSDPDDAFTIEIPPGWKVEREEKDGAYMTIIRPEQYSAANLSIMTINVAQPKNTSADLQSYMLSESSRPFFQGWINGLKEQARVEGTGEIYPTEFANVSAMRMDVTYYRNDADDPREGYSLFLNGDKTTFFISLTGSRARFNELKEIISTLRIEP